MRIALNLLYLIPGVVGGTETYASGLLTGLAAADREDEFLVFTNAEGAEWPIPDAPNFTRVVCPVPGSSRLARYVFEQLRLPRLLEKHSVDIIHSLGYVSPLYTSCPRVVTIHDLNYRAFGDQMPAVRRLSLKLFVEQSARRANHVITVSDFARREIIQHLGVAPESIQTIHLAPPHWLTCTQPEQDKRFVTCEALTIMAFASGSPNKNIRRLISAFAAVRASYGVAARLTLVGHVPPGGALESMVQSLGLTDYVTFAGRVDNCHLSEFLRSSSLLAFPSTYEGFGLPVLEAMAVGTPVVCSNAASLPEVAGDAALYFDPLSIDEMAAALARVASDERLREDLRQRGFQNVQRFSWERTARETLQAYRRVLNP